MPFYSSGPPFRESMGFFQSAFSLSAGDFSLLLDKCSGMYCRIPADESPHPSKRDPGPPACLLFVRRSICSGVLQTKKMEVFMRKFSVQDLTLAALLAAVYATLTLVLPSRLHRHPDPYVEALTVLPFLFPAATRACSWGASWPTCFPLSAGHRVRLRRHPSGLPDDPSGMPSRWLAPLPRCCATPPPSWGRESPGLRTGFGPGFLVRPMPSTP